MANSNNNKTLIQTLREQMIMAGIHVKQVETDADTLIVSTALTTGVSEELAIVVGGTDTDLRVKVVDRATSYIAMCMLCRNSPTTLYNTHDIQYAIGDTTKHLMFLHAEAGCDTVSAIYRQSMRKTFNAQKLTHPGL